MTIQSGFVTHAGQQQQQTICNFLMSCRDTETFVILNVSGENTHTRTLAPQNEILLRLVNVYGMFF